MTEYKYSMSPSYRSAMRALGAEIRVSIHDDMKAIKTLTFGKNYNHEVERQKLIKIAKEARTEANRLSTGEYP